MLSNTRRVEHARMAAVRVWPSRTIVYVHEHDPAVSTLPILSVWGESDWFRNIRCRLATLVEVGCRRFVPEQRVLSVDDVAEIQLRFRQRAPAIAWAQAHIMGWVWPASYAQLRELAARMRGVEFRPPTGAGYGVFAASG